MRTNYPFINREEILVSFIPLLHACGIKQSINDIASKSRLRELVYARAVISVCLRNHGFSFAKIGYVINRDHAAVMHLLKKTEYNSRYGLNHKTISAFKNPALTTAVSAAVINYHQERITYHQNIINQLKESNRSYQLT